VTETPPRPPGTRSNDFDALRLAGALLVIVGHAAVLVGEPEAAPRLLGMPVHGLGVAIFFSISGYLIMGSWLRRPEVGRYVASRAARILPALAVVTILSIVVVGPIFTTLGLGAYASDPGTWRYLANLVPVLPQYELPGVFGGLPYPDVVNGSIWTLRAEFLCYLAVVLVGMLPAKARPWCIAIAALVAAAAVPLQLRVAGSDVSQLADVLVYFAVGALIRIVVPRSALRPLVGLGGLAALAVLGGALGAVAPLVPHALAWIVLPYAVVSIGLASTPVVRRAARFGDLSYGIYLWAFPVQQALLVLAPGTGMLPSILIVTPVSAALALASWHLVEQPAMRAKDRLLRRREVHAG
jgi:peptidoglycan/LPS O-acetylase OafA/YrhL